MFLRQGTFLLIPAFCLLLIGCGDTADSLPNIEATVETRVSQSMDSEKDQSGKIAELSVANSMLRDEIVALTLRVDELSKSNTTQQETISQLQANLTDAQGKLSTTPPRPTPVIVGMGQQNQGGNRPPDTYACNINVQGYCIFTGSPHQTGLQPGTVNIVNRDGAILFPVSEAVAINAAGAILEAKGTPAFDGDELTQRPHDSLTDDERAFHKVMAIMFPIRNALMYDIASISLTDWNSLVLPLSARSIKETTYTGGPTPRDNYYSRQGIYELAKHPNGRDIHHDVMKFLEESGIQLLCHVTSNEFTRMLQENHPEGHSPCEDAGITSKIPFQN